VFVPLYGGMDGREEGVLEACEGLCDGPYRGHAGRSRSACGRGTLRFWTVIQAAGIVPCGCPVLKPYHDVFIVLLTIALPCSY